MKTLIDSRQIKNLPGEDGGFITTPVTHPGYRWETGDNFRLTIPDTGGDEYSDVPSTQVVQFDFISHNYFTSSSYPEVPGHFAIVGRCDTSLIASQVRGQGMILGFGNPFLPGHERSGPRWWPSSQIESFWGSLGNTLNSETDGYPNRLLQDGLLYRVMLFTTLAPSGDRYIRYRLLGYNSNTSQWDIERDTGDVLDYHPSPSMLSSGFAMSHVFSHEVVSWAFEVSDISIYWTDAYKLSPHVPTLTASTGGGGGVTELDGVMTWTGNSPRLKANTSSSVFNSRWAFQDSTSDTTFTAIPGSGSSQASFLSTNSSDLTGSFKTMAVGMFGNTARIESLGVGENAAPIEVWLEGDVVARFEGKRMLVDSNNNDFSRRFAFQEITNNPTTLVAVPGGGSSQASFMAVDNSSLTGSFRTLAAGISSSGAFIESLGVGVSARPIDFKIEGQTVLTMDGPVFDQKGAGSRYRADTSSGAISSRWAFQNLNSGTTTHMVIPGSGSTNAEYTVTNSPSMTGTYRSLSMKMLGNTPRIESSGSSAGLGNPIHFRVGTSDPLQVTSDGILFNRGSIALGSDLGWNITFSGTHWRTGSFNTDTFPSTISECADEVVGLKRVVAALYADLKATGAI